MPIGNGCACVARFAARILGPLLGAALLASCDGGGEIVDDTAAGFHGSRQSINAGWRFRLGDDADYASTELDDSGWRLLDLPHDFSIEGEIRENNAAGKAGGFYPGGTGWYRKLLPWDPAWQDARVLLSFDGIMMRSRIFVNGRAVSGQAYGYLGQTADVTERLVPGEPLLIAVRADNDKMPSGRWYTGSGIYRNAWLDVRAPVRLAFDGSWVRTLRADDDDAELLVSHELRNDDSVPVDARIETTLIAPSGDEIRLPSQAAGLDARSTGVVEFAASIESPRRWSVEAPALYRMETRVFVDGALVDRQNRRIGIRTIDVSVDSGFLLNGVPVEIRGVCLHHDGGAVGAAVPKDVWRRRLELLKNMGVNAIRVGHTPFAPEFYDLTDELGLMVMDEAFDGWEKEKAAFDYGLVFEERWREDLSAFIRRDRHHASVVFWSIGNEVHEATPETQKALADHVRALDDSRPITQGEGSGLGHDDIAGFNGHGEFRGAIEAYHAQHPDRPVIGTEITHTLHTRDVYRSRTEYRTRDNPAPWELQSNRRDGKSHLDLWNSFKDRVFYVPDFTNEEVWPEEPLVYASSFDNNLVRMGIRDQIRLSEELPYLLGTFRWTGIDYLGESFDWPARTANFGVIDLAGFPKGVYYLYQSRWSAKPMVHVDPHWTQPGKEGSEIPVVVYTNLEEAELFLNDRSLGRRIMGEEMQLVWTVPYEPGVIRAVAYGEDDVTVSAQRSTAGDPARISVRSDRAGLPADGESVAHLDIEVTDTDGVRVPWAGNRLFVEVDGPARLIGLENGDILEHQSVKDGNRKVFRGRLLAMVQSLRTAGVVRVTVRGDGLAAASVDIRVRTP